MRDNSRAYTLVTPAETIVSDVNDPTSTMWIEETSFHSDVAMERVPRPGRHGSIQRNSVKDGGVWTSAWRLIGDAATIDANETLLLRALNSTLERGLGELQWESASGIEQRLPGLQLLSEDPKIDGTTKIIQVQLASERPAAEDLHPTIVDSDPLTAGGSGFTIPLTVPFTIVGSTGGSLSLDNSDGSFHAWPILRAYGPIDAPRITNLATGEALVFSGSIGPGDYWEIDLFAGTVMLNGATKITTIDDAQSDWFAIGTGEIQGLQLSGSNYSTSTLLRAYMRSGRG